MKGDRPLTDEDIEVLSFEKQHFRYAGAKDSAIRDRFGNVTHYYQRLNSLLDHPSAWQREPMLLQRLDARRTTRRRHG